MNRDSPTLCALPFGHLFLSEEGKSFPCCYALESGEPNRDEQGRVVTASADLEKIWNCADQRKVRLQMLAGEKPKACARCFGLEEHGLQSMREVSNRRFPEELARALPLVREDGSLPLELFSLDLRLGNLCNLRCQMCSPVSSRLMARDTALLYPGSGPSDEKAVALDWHKDPTFLAKLLAASGQVREAHFAGGEPFLIPEVALFVEELAKTPAAKKMRLSFNTNVTVLPEKLLGMFPRFESVRLVLSLDGLGPVNDYIRFPSKFDRVLANLRELHRRREEWSLTFVCFNVTVQVHNIFSLPELLRFLPRELPGFLPFPVLGPLNYPECLSVKVLPAAAKEKAAAQLRALCAEERDYWKEIETRDPTPNGAARFTEHVEGLVKFMQSEDRSELLPELRRFNSVIEGIRGQKLAVPEL